MATNPEEVLVPFETLSRMALVEQEKMSKDGLLLYLVDIIKEFLFFFLATTEKINFASHRTFNVTIVRILQF